MGNGLEAVRHGVNSVPSVSFIGRCLGHAEVDGHPQPKVMMGVCSYDREAVLL